MSQFSVPCSVYRGGTSRGLFFHEKDLPKDVEARNQIFRSGIDSYNSSQVNGLGGATSSTSKVCIVSPSDREGADVEWTFYQLGVSNPIVDDNGTCGNLMAAVGAFAVNEGMVEVKPQSTVKRVLVYNRNIHKTIQMDVPLVEGKAQVKGEYKMPGLIGSGAKIEVSILEPGGESTGSTLSLGAVSTVEVEGDSYPITFSDLINPAVFLDGKTLGLSGCESLKEVQSNKFLLGKLAKIRNQGAVNSGIAEDLVDAEENKQSIPKIALISPAHDYVTTDGKKINKDKVDILVKVISMGKFHRTSPASILYNLSACTTLKGTLPYQMAGTYGEKRDREIRIGHPEGVVTVRVRTDEKEEKILGVGIDRTACRILKGDLFVSVI